MAFIAVFLLSVKDLSPTFYGLCNLFGALEKINLQ